MRAGLEGAADRISGMFDQREIQASIAASESGRRRRSTYGDPSTMDEQQIRAELRSWILEHAKSNPGGELTDQTAILETGLLSSLDVVEFVLFIEELRGDEVDTDDLEPEVFTSIDTLWTGFFAPLAS